MCKKTKYNSIELGIAAKEMLDIKRMVEGYIDILPGVTYTANEEKIRVGCDREGGILYLNKILVNTVVEAFGSYTKNLEVKERDIRFDFISLEEYVSVTKSFND